ncbi:hypothetical protein HUG10_11670 [Halorarum halophilum]|uniref:Uncharacterized protein n=1 Tax=Halorarum halophilum TaxID=2743090 RepID=A0A7D5GCD9_9EURY|nr:hypothetical protein [Halobaculum halophilum]QLG28166.1 hypothetical protein HUG10_11670 [Halobaculum halophilum]
MGFLHHPSEQLEQVLTTPIGVDGRWRVMTQLTTDDIRFLQAVARCDGHEVTTSQIRRETGFSDEKTRYRHKKLEDAGHIIGDRAGPEQNDPRTATLSDRGQRTVDAVDLKDEAEPPQSMEAIRERLLEVETRVQLMSQQSPSTSDSCDYTATLRKITNTLDELQGTVAWHEKIVEAVYIADFEDIALTDALEDV